MFEKSILLINFGQLYNYSNLSFDCGARNPPFFCNLKSMKCDGNET